MSQATQPRRRNATKNKYRSYNLTPFAIETHGRLGLDALGFLSMITQHNTETDPQTAYHLALQRISTTLQIHNANTIIHHYNTPAGDEDVDM